MPRLFQLSLIPIFLGTSLGYYVGQNTGEAQFWAILGIIQTVIFIFQKRYNQSKQ